MVDLCFVKDVRGNLIREVWFGGEVEVLFEEEVGICVIFFCYLM